MECLCASTSVAVPKTNPLITFGISQTRRSTEFKHFCLAVGHHSPAQKRTSNYKVFTEKSTSLKCFPPLIFHVVSSHAFASRVLSCRRPFRL